MKLPFSLALMGGIAAASSREFATGWANGLVRWAGRVVARSEGGGYLYAENSFERGSTKYAASEAALTFMREREQ